jgi:hypothetical protein
MTFESFSDCVALCAHSDPLARPAFMLDVSCATTSTHLFVLGTRAYFGTAVKRSTDQHASKSSNTSMRFLGARLLYRMDPLPFIV